MNAATVSLIVALIAAARQLTPELIEMIEAWKSNAEISPAELAQIDAELAAARARLAEVYSKNGVQ